MSCLACMFFILPVDFDQVMFFLDIHINNTQGFQSADSSHVINLCLHQLCLQSIPCGLIKCTEQNVNNKSLTQVSQLYVHVSFCLKAIRPWNNLSTGGHRHVICMLDTVEVVILCTYIVWRVIVISSSISKKCWLYICTLCSV